MLKRGALIAVVAAMAGGVAWGQARVETIDARQFQGRMVSLGAGELVIRTSTKEQKLALRDLVEVTLAAAADPMTGAGQVVLVTAGGYRVAVSELALADGRFRFSSVMLGRAELPIAAVAEIYLPPGTVTPGDVEQRCRKIYLSRQATKDVLVVAGKGDKWVSVEGVVKSIGAEKIALRWRDNDRTVSLASVRAIRLAGVGAKPARPAGLVVGRDGSTLSFSSISLKGQWLAVKTADLGARKIALKFVAAVRFISDRVVDLAGLKPVAVRQYGFFDPPVTYTASPPSPAGDASTRPALSAPSARRSNYRLNRSFSGGPLKLGGRVYRRGLGLHSFCELSYVLDGSYTAFFAIAGIDDAVRPSGQVELTILADGKVVGRPVQLSGKEDPRMLRLPIRGARRLTIRADFGRDGLGVGDHVDLASARLIK